MKIITAAEARQMVIDNIKLNSVMLEKFFKEVEETSKEGKSNMVFRDGDGHSLGDDEENFLEKLGYDLSWNGACLWYEVSW